MVAPAAGPNYTYVATGLSVAFTDTSTTNNPPITAWAWNFGDGATSAVQNPTHVYAAAGTYTVTLSYTDYLGASTTFSQAITVSSAAPNFTQAISGLQVTFTDTSTSNNPPIQSWSWNFGDGGSSGLQDPVHTYAAPGTYTVTLSYTDYAGPSATTASHTVTVANPTVASFTAAMTALTGVFTDTSVPTTGATITAWAWNFGDGTTSTAQSPTHTYASPGNYTVSLTVTDSGNSTIGPVTQVVTALAPPVASFTKVIANLTVALADTSTASNGKTIAGWSWNFGDGTAGSTVKNPTHTYAVAGTYIITLTVTDSGGLVSAVANQSVTVAVAGVATYTAKGFIDFGALANNTPETVATLGELSVKSRTFAKDRQIFGGSTGGTTPSSINLSVFSSKNADGTVVLTPADYASSMLQIGTWMYTQSLAGLFTADPNVFLQAVVAEFPTLINTVTCGPMVQQGTMWLPTDIQYYFSTPSTVSPTNTASSRVRIWFSDSAFQQEYDEFTIIFIPPIANLDDFFLPAATVQTEVSAITTPQLFGEVQTAAGQDPYTVLMSTAYNWVDPNTPTNLIPTLWTYIIYGEAGNNVDAIKAALQGYILAGSTHTRDQWAAIFPDIFTSTEFILTPLWNQYAIPNLTLGDGVYSPTVNPAQALLIAQETAVGTGYNDLFVSNVLNVVPTPYKSMAILAVGGPQNHGGISEFAKRWTDYIAVPTTSLDYDRMSTDTQGFVSLLQSMLKTAETMTESSDIPPGMTRMHRTAPNGDIILYLVSSYDSVEYLMVAKSWLVAKYGASTNTTGTIGISYDGIYNNGAYQLSSTVAQMSLQFAAYNAVAPVSWSILSTNIGTASINATTGLFTGNFAATGVYTLTLEVIDAQAFTSRQTFTFNFVQQVVVPPLVLGSPVLPNPAPGVGVAYNGSIAITGGTAPYTLVSSTLAPGLSAAISGNSVVISGAATTNTGSPFSSSVTVRDSTAGTPLSTTETFSITIA